MGATTSLDIVANTNETLDMVIEFLEHHLSKQVARYALLFTKFANLALICATFGVLAKSTPWPHDRSANDDDQLLYEDTSLSRNVTLCAAFVQLGMFVAPIPFLWLFRDRQAEQEITVYSELTIWYCSLLSVPSRVMYYATSPKRLAHSKWFYWSYILNPLLVLLAQMGLWFLLVFPLMIGGTNEPYDTTEKALLIVQISLGIIGQILDFWTLGVLHKKVGAARAREHGCLASACVGCCGTMWCCTIFCGTLLFFIIILVFGILGITTETNYVSPAGCSHVEMVNAKQLCKTFCTNTLSGFHFRDYALLCNKDGCSDAEACGYTNATNYTTGARYLNDTNGALMLVVSHGCHCESDNYYKTTDVAFESVISIVVFVVLCFFASLIAASLRHGDIDRDFQARQTTFPSGEERRRERKLQKAGASVRDPSSHMNMNINNLSELQQVTVTNQVTPTLSGNRVAPL